MGRYNLENLITAIVNPGLILRECLLLTEKPIKPIYDVISERKFGQGIDVIKQDWDNLIILDACRSDYFLEMNNIEGQYQTVISQGTYSTEFLEKNFSDSQLYDTIYVTANPHFRDIEENVFFKIIPVLDRWNDEIGTVLPEDVVQVAIETYENHPDKRLITHFMQPHRPYLGHTAEIMRQRFTERGFDKYRRLEHKPIKQRGISVFRAVKEDIVSVSELRMAYRETLQITLNHIKTLVDSLPGKSVITADHGEMLGERLFPWSAQHYGHSVFCRTPELCRVPWLINNSDHRRQIVSEEPEQVSYIDSSKIEDRLRALGYSTHD